MSAGFQYKRHAKIYGRRLPRYRGDNFDPPPPPNGARSTQSQVDEPAWKRLSLWNFATRRRCLIMKFFGSAVTALIVLWLIDKELNHGHYTQSALAVLRGLARSIGIR
ncbi:hypothetical protein [Bradyrhizobium sp. AUGA SZCCT0182]|uniref:hypothetical protein n=1 Tax=Bradyrhizobium sp. AUGA SZCCT0182 TaxID=2807667 RepID=UPI001BADC193|nr:hypothetical protein [Bradyrhizobium sp. AUGA SZCCT0182]MBR1237550.1 hypothetical protein [Bradyrhizobium sp. AUGA SZCCT0182]